MSSAALIQPELDLQVELQNSNYKEAAAEFEHFKLLKEFHPVHLVYCSKINKYIVHIYSPTKAITYYPTNKIILSTNTNKN